MRSNTLTYVWSNVPRGSWWEIRMEGGMGGDCVCFCFSQLGVTHTCSCQLRLVISSRYLFQEHHCSRSLVQATQIKDISRDCCFTKTTNCLLAITYFSLDYSRNQVYIGFSFICTKCEDEPLKIIYLKIEG